MCGLPALLIGLLKCTENVWAASALNRSYKMHRKGGGCQHSDMSYKTGIIKSSENVRAASTLIGLIKCTENVWAASILIGVIKCTENMWATSIEQVLHSAHKTCLLPTL